MPKIAGEIRRFLRDDGPIKVSRTLKGQALLVRRARETLSAALGREPRLSELVRDTGLAEEEILACEQALLPVDSLQREGEEGGLPSFAVEDGFEDQTVERLALREAIDRLPPEDRTLIGLRYDHGLTQQAAAQILGISQVQVSRREKRILSHLRENFTCEE